MCFSSRRKRHNESQLLTDCLAVVQRQSEKWELISAVAFWQEIGSDFITFYRPKAAFSVTALVVFIWSSRFTFLLLLWAFYPKIGFQWRDIETLRFVRCHHTGNCDKRIIGTVELKYVLHWSDIMHNNKCYTTLQHDMELLK